ncbi:MAG: 16S rRNA (cytosine(967)-C(5))-methyltransferase RsmB [Clostridia bacterium]|nr:16S rRNA (cytosine(967)-C(5))-methyltransferase RsmB [Clostridia bacterium]
MSDARTAAYFSLVACEESAGYTNIQLNHTIKRDDFDPRERALYTVLVYGVTERKISLDYQIYKLSGKDISKFQTSVLYLIRMGLYQLIYMDSIPDHAAVSTVMELAKKQVNPGARGLINAILREAQRKLKKEDGSYRLIAPDRSRDLCGYLSITYSVPRYLCKAWIKAYGEEKTESILKAFDKPAPITLRVNLLKTDRAALLSELADAGITALPSKHTKDGIILPDGGAISDIDALKSGKCFVQDDASRLCVEALGPREGETVFDLCACPGGKSFAAAIAMKNCGSVRSFDLHESKLSLITDGAERLGISIISARAADSTQPIPELFEAADRVLCDVPCSGFGTLAKKPDLRNKPADSIRDLPSLQLKILENGSKYVKKGGILVYSTCTLMPTENELNVTAFLTLHPEFSLITASTLFPDNGTDGFFFAKMQRL